ncbi:MAG: hypothetical protein KDB50_03075 [Mycobacterium sp.]|nr:hypothetical protein [Mycobacterium sp.]
MEGQRPDPGAVRESDAAATEPANPAETAAKSTEADTEADAKAVAEADPEAAEADTEAAEADDEADDADADTEAAEGDADDVSPPVTKPKQPSAARRWFVRHRTPVAVISAAVSFVAAGAFAGAAAEPYLTERASVATKLRIAETATDAITTLWSYTPENMDTLPDRSAKYLGGDFEEQYRKYVDAIAATNKQAKVTSTTQVVGAAVESLRGGATGTEATAIVYTNTTSTTPQNINFPSMKYLSYRLELKRFGRDWRVTKMTTVTSLDLTPKL